MGWLTSGAALESRWCYVCRVSEFTVMRVSFVSPWRPLTDSTYSVERNRTGLQVRYRYVSSIIVCKANAIVVAIIGHSFVETSIVPLDALL